METNVKHYTEKQKRKKEKEVVNFLAFITGLKSERKPCNKA